ncbi:MAG: hypothetical protein HQL56_01785 [Magnetococcales bacterium]|nr:hypothetical protein [Magnetococcales bacterium]
MTIPIVDTNVVSKWHLEEEEREAAMPIAGGGEVVLALDLLAAEVGDVLKMSRRYCSKTDVQVRAA